MMMPASTSRGVVRRAAMMAKPTAVTSMAIASDSSVIGTLQPIGTGKENASMPMKCIDQIPPPIAVAAATIQPMRAQPVDDQMRDATLSETNDAQVATPIDNRTSIGS